MLTYAFRLKQDENLDFDFLFQYVKPKKSDALSFLIIIKCVPRLLVFEF